MEWLNPTLKPYGEVVITVKDEPGLVMQWLGCKPSTEQWLGKGFTWIRISDGWCPSRYGDLSGELYRVHHNLVDKHEMKAKLEMAKKYLAQKE